MSEPERPKPLYGEYASEEERTSALERSGVSHEDVKAHAPRVNSAPDIPATVAPSPRRSVDRIATVFLLSFGVVFIIGGASNYLNLAETLQESMQRFGMGGYRGTAQTAGIGIAMLVSQILFWVGAAVLSYRRIARHKLAWWVPLIAGILSFVVLTVLLGVLLAADPTFVATIPNA